MLCTRVRADSGDPQMQRENKGFDRAAFPVATGSGSMRASYIANLNAQQQDAVEHGTERPLLIIAGAGSGKTNTLAHRVAHLIASGADARRIMLLTFSRRAAAEMQRRVERITAHALAPVVGRSHGRWLGRALFTLLVRGSCVNMHAKLGSMSHSQFTIAKIRPIS